MDKIDQPFTFSGHLSRTANGSGPQTAGDSGLQAGEAGGQAGPARPSASLDRKTEPRASQRRPAKLLFADDNEIIVSTMADFLRANGYHVTTASNGVEMVEQARSTRPDLILADIQMPRMDGLEAIRTIRALDDLHLQQVPIIAITALAMAGDEERCLQAGANLYLSKPIRLGKLLETIKGFLPLR